MQKTVRMLFLSAILLLGGGWSLYHLGTQVNSQNDQIVQVDPELWDQAPGDKWLYVGGLMMLLSGALGAAAVLMWTGNRGDVIESTLTQTSKR